MNMKKNEKGFTLIEVLVTIIVIALLVGIGILNYSRIFNIGEERYYSSLESNILFAGSDYFNNHRSEMPIENHYNEVSIESLVEGKYLEPVKDSKGNICNDGEVYLYRENNIPDSFSYL